MSSIIWSVEIILSTGFCTGKSHENQRASLGKVSTRYVKDGRDATWLWIGYYSFQVGYLSEVINYSNLMVAETIYNGDISPVDILEA